ncbi:hypothetical protein V6N13_140442 [Hibiscus sabdariffa]
MNWWLMVPQLDKPRQKWYTSVVFDKDGVLEQICSSKGYIDMSTVDPREIGQNMTAETAQLVIRAAGKEM